MKSKKCSRCGEIKELTEFHKNKSRKDGLQSYCKICFKKFYILNAASILGRQKIYHSTEAGKVAMKRGDKKNKQKHPGKIITRQITNNAIRDGKITRQPCRICGSKAQAHHLDYNKPLELDWLCIKHHHELHRSLR